MKVHCRAYKDVHKFEKWPEVFSFSPQKGDLIKSKDGVVLKIIQITHCFVEEYDRNSGEYVQKPYVIIDLD